MRLLRILPLVLTALLLAAYSTGQADEDDSISGMYEGVAESEEIGDVPIRAEVWEANGQVMGSLYTERGSIGMSGNYYSDGYWYLELQTGAEGGTVKGALVEQGLFTGTWQFAGLSGTIVMQKME